MKWKSMQPQSQVLESTTSFSSSFFCFKIDFLFHSYKLTDYLSQFNWNPGIQSKTMSPCGICV